MGDDVNSLVRLPPASLRFLGVLERSDPSAITSYLPLELDESDVVWSSANSPSSSPPAATATVTATFSSSSAASSPSDHFRRNGRAGSNRLGLSAVLAEDGLPHVRRGAAAKPVPAGCVAAGREERIFHQSAPVNVPAWPGRRRTWRRFDSLEEDGDEEEDKDREEDVEEEEDEEMVPPHVIVAKSHVMTFSVFEGVGRTLKGRDLRRVRNAVFQKTGFLN